MQKVGFVCMFIRREPAMLGMDGQELTKEFYIFQCWLVLLLRPSKSQASSFTR